MKSTTSNVVIGTLGLFIALVLAVFVVFRNNMGLRQGVSLPRLRPSDLPSATAGYHPDGDIHVLPREADNLTQFLKELKVSLDAHQLINRPVDLIFNYKNYYADLPHPACSGLWVEFGVYRGGTLNMSAVFRERYCGLDAGPVYGFDTFTGLPEKWANAFKSGAFSLGGNLPPVHHNARLVKGLFSDSLQPWIEQQKVEHAGTMPPITYLHIDCDLYAGARDALTLLSEYIAPGCLLIFDELLHYPQYKQHEVKALWEYIQTTGRKIRVVGIRGPMSAERPQEAVDLDLEVHTQRSWPFQSVAFVVL